MKIVVYVKQPTRTGCCGEHLDLRKFTSSERPVPHTKAFNLDVAEVDAFRRGDEVVLRKPRLSGLATFEALTRIELPDDFPDDIADPPAEIREPL